MDEVITFELYEPLDYTDLDGMFHLREFFIKKNGDKWEFHKYDADGFPSKPHGHCAEKSEKLDVNSGVIYNARTRQPVRKVSPKKLVEIRQSLLEKGFLKT
jgi:hypothetical protein